MSTRAPKPMKHAGYNLMIDEVWQAAMRKGRGVQRLDVVAIAELLRDYITTKTRENGGTKKLRWPRFGTFSIRRRKARNIRNPVTLEVMRLERSWALTFRASIEQKGPGDAP